MYSLVIKTMQIQTEIFPKDNRKVQLSPNSSISPMDCNQGRFQGNINDLPDEGGKNKIFEHTIKWKNIEWTLSCSEGDYAGHDRLHSNFPHYHFPMRIDEKQFINFNDHHIPFTEDDLAVLDLKLSNPDFFIHSFGAGGAGMQEAMELNPEDIIEHSTLSQHEKSATYQMQTFIMANDKPLDGTKIKALFDESRKTGKTLAQLALKYFEDEAQIKTVISPADTIPDVAKRK